MRIDKSVRLDHSSMKNKKLQMVNLQGESIVFAYSGLPSLAREARDKILAKCSDRSNEIVYTRPPMLS